MTPSDRRQDATRRGRQRNTSHPNGISIDQCPGRILVLTHATVLLTALVSFTDWPVVPANAQSPASSQTAAQPQPTAEEKETIGDPRIFGFRLAPGRVRWSPEPVNAYIKTDDGHTIGRVHVKVGKDFIVMMPDGQLEARSASQVRFTDRPVTWATVDEMASQITSEPKLIGFKTIKGKKHLFVYNTSDKMAEVTSRVMESMTRGLQKYMKTLGVDAHEPEAPLAVIMFKTEQEFQDYKRMPAGVVAYYNIITNRVYLYEESPLLKLDRNLAIRQTLSTIAHEGAHQILANIGVQKRLSLWPMWFSEGMAEFLAPTSVTRGFKWKGAGQINDFRMLELETHLRTEALDGIDGETIRDTTAAARLTSTGYASAWSLVNFLAKRHRSDFREFLKQVSKLRPFEGSFPNEAVKGKIEKNVQQFSAVFGDDFEDIEKDMIQYLSRQKFESPFSGFVHYAVLVEIPAEKARQKSKKHSAVFHTEALAQRWAADLFKKSQESESGGGRRPAIKIVRCVNRADAILKTKLFYGGR